MFERMEILGRVVEVDVAKTRAYYDRVASIAETCGCGNCRNFVQACSHLPPELLQLFERLGIDPTKEGEVFEFGPNDDGTHFYGGFFHFVGKIVDASSDSWHPVGDGFHAGLTSDADLVPKDFPRPILQLDFQGNVPWVLDERPD